MVLGPALLHTNPSIKTIENTRKTAVWGGQEGWPQATLVLPPFLAKVGPDWPDHENEPHHQQFSKSTISNQA
jgi:hypothetical protein